MKITRWTTLAALVLAATSVAHAQGGPPAGFTPPSGPPTGMTGGGMAGAPTGGAATGAAAGDTGAVSNVQTLDSTTTTTSSSGIGTDGDMSMSSESGQLPSTGGEPVLMSLVGLSMALGAFAIRKRVSA